MSFVFRCCSLLLLAALLPACQAPSGDTDDGDTTLTAASLGTQSVRTPDVYLKEVPYATASQALGERLLMQCRACHSVAADGVNQIGPALHGVFGRPAGSQPGFAYSRALADAEFVWTPRALDAWLAAPGRFLPGNQMTFPGLPDAGDRAAVIATLLVETSDAGPE